MRSSEPKDTKSTSEISDTGSIINSAAKSKRFQRIISNAAKVMFQEPSSTQADQDHRSDERLLEIPSITDEQVLNKTKEVSIVSLKTDFAQNAVKRTSAADSHDALKLIETRTRRQISSQAELARPPSGPLKGDDQFIYKDQQNSKRSTGFLGYTIKGMLTQFHNSRSRIYRDGSVLRTTTETSARTSGTRTRFSENVGVHSLVIDPPQMDQLPHLEAAAITVILQEAVDFLDILEHIIPAPVEERWDESYKTIDERYGKPRDSGIMLRQNKDFISLIPTVNQKIQRDRTYICNVLKGTLKELACSRRYDRLEVEVDDIVRILEGEHSLEINNEIWLGQVKQLQELIESNRLENEKEATQLLASTQEMNAAIDNAIFLNSAKLGYVERWEQARLEQQKLRLEIKEQKLTDALRECEKMETADQIVSGEVRTFLQANIKDLEEETIAWASRWNEEVERVGQEIDDMKEKIELQRFELENLYKLRDERQVFLDECYAEKERIKNEAEYWDAVHNAATLIQNLWRGYMVRHQLGQYNNLWTNLKKRKRRAAIARKKIEKWEKQKAAEWGSTQMKKLKNIIDPNA